ncbi:hypothetical protein GOP47_0019599 [Adiantum capillus-veneris]|uniref:DDE Tnp4 domain-containing protein n=1 Tax=Adiantum capillus-veneris TaxID=13818 RepID=A0A9D4UCV3_ADICA|nr:hypothetical protein GOP47_0019599 [Adiantum capillus-veneris]
MTRLADHRGMDLRMHLQATIPSINALMIFTVEKKVAIAVMVIASRNTHYHVANAFGCGRSTVTTFLHEFVRSLVHKGGHLIKWPTTESEMRDVKDGFRALRGLPHCCGAIDCTHINMDLPRNEQRPCNDKRVLRNLGMYRLCQGGDRLRGATFEFQEFSFPEYIVGDGGYVLLPWLMIPFQRPEMVSQRHRNYNFMQSSTRIVVERAFS